MVKMYLHSPLKLTITKKLKYKDKNNVDTYSVALHMRIQSKIPSSKLYAYHNNFILCEKRLQSFSNVALRMPLVSFNNHPYIREVIYTVGNSRFDSLCLTWCKQVRGSRVAVWSII